MPRAVSNPPNPWESQHVDWLGEPPPAQLTVYEEQARSILSHNDSPDLPFRWSLNPYRGCQHACAYCYARPTHQYLGYGAGTDFDTRIVVKVNAAKVLERELSRRGWKHESITFSGVTDCYQPLEASYGVTRACLEVCAEHRQPVAVITKSALIRRDIDVLQRIARHAPVRVFLSIPFADDAESTARARAMEPWGAAPAMRFATLDALSRAGLETGVAIAPLIPGLNDADVPRILTRARESGARRAFTTLLRLAPEVRPVFEARLTEAFPLRAAKVLSQMDELRPEGFAGMQFGRRFEGVGPRWDAMNRLFALHCARLGLEYGPEGSSGRVGPVAPLSPAAGGSPAPQPVQGELF